MSRPRLPRHIVRQLEQISDKRGCSFQQATQIVLDRGLRDIGESPAAPPPENATYDSTLIVPVPAAARTIIKRLAAAEYRSNRSMTRALLLEGLKSFGVWPPADAVPTNTTIRTEAEHAPQA